jgi:hypothetical protein
MAEQRKNDELIVKVLELEEPRTLRLTSEDMDREIERELAKLADDPRVEVAGTVGAASRKPKGRAA